jgi:hypothetical protein
MSLVHYLIHLTLIYYQSVGQGGAGWGPLVARDLQRPKNFNSYTNPAQPCRAKKKKIYIYIYVYLKAYRSHPTRQKTIFMRGVMRKVR